MRVTLYSIFSAFYAVPLACAQPGIAPSACPEFPVSGPITSAFLTSSIIANPVHATDITAIESIRHTAALYALTLDSRSFDTLRHIFTPNATANYSDPIGLLTGVDSIISTLTSSLAPFASTQHLLGTQYIFICGANKAVSVTYFTASHFFTPYTSVQDMVGNDKVLVDHSQYLDTWVRSGAGWRIGERKLARMGPITLDKPS